MVRAQTGVEMEESCRSQRTDWGEGQLGCTAAASATIACSSTRAKTPSSSTASGIAVRLIGEQKGRRQGFRSG